MQLEILYLIIFVLAIYICYHFSSKSKFTKPIENLTNRDTSDYSEPTRKFFKVLNDIKLSDKIILKDIVSKRYLNKQTIDPELNTKVINILKKVISNLNNILQKEEYYIHEIDNLYIIKDNKGNFRIITISMLNDVKNFYTVKFLMDLVYFNGQYYLNYLNIDESAVTNLLNTYDIRQIDNYTGGILLNYDMVNNDIEAALNNHYVENNNIYDLKKIEKTSFNFFKLDDFSKYYLPEGVPNIYAPYFCKKYNEQIWDSFGNPVKNNNIPEACVANNNAYRKIFNDPYDAPGVLYSEDTNNYSWLFSFFSNAGIVTSDLS